MRVASGEKLVEQRAQRRDVTGRGGESGAFPRRGIVVRQHRREPGSTRVRDRLGRQLADPTEQSFEHELSRRRLVADAVGFELGGPAELVRERGEMLQDRILGGRELGDQIERAHLHGRGGPGIEHLIECREVQLATEIEAHAGECLEHRRRLVGRQGRRRHDLSRFDAEDARLTRGLRVDALLRKHQLARDFERSALILRRGE